VQGGEHILAAVAEREIYRTHKTELVAILQVVREFWYVFSSAQVNCKFGHFFAVVIEQGNFSFFVAG
jgi:hypothetical protein